MAFPLAQKSNPLKRDSIKVEQLAQMQAFAFSALSATVTPTSKTPPHSRSIKASGTNDRKGQFDLSEKPKQT